MSHPDYRPPSQCHEFFRTEEEPVWYGRVKDLHKENQALYIFGHAEDNFELEYDVYIRGGAGYKLIAKN